MTLTKADIIAAREAVDMMPKEALNIFGNEEANAYEDKYKGAESPPYWNALWEEEKKNNPNADVKEFMSLKWTEYMDATKKYQEDVKRGGGMLDRYTGSAGGIGGVLGALLGGVLGGGKGALIGGLIGSMGLYAMQKFGLFEGTEFDKFFRSSVDKYYGDPVSEEDIKQSTIAASTAMETVQKKLGKAGLGASKDPVSDPVTDAEVPVTPPEDPNVGIGQRYMADEKEFDPENLAKPVEDPITPTVAAPEVPTPPPTTPKTLTPTEQWDADEAKAAKEQKELQQTELAKARADYDARVQKERDTNAAKVADQQAAAADRKAANMNKRPAVSGLGAQKDKGRSFYDNILPEGKTGYTGLLRPLNAFGAWHDMVLGGTTKNKIKALSPEKPEEISELQKNYLKRTYK